MTYESLLKEAAHLRVDTYEKPMKPNVKGLYYDKAICLNASIQTTAEKTCILAEELGHYHTTAGNILNQTSISNRKQELRARQWGFQKLVPLFSIVQAHRSGVKSRYELAEYLGVTEEFLSEALRRYQEKFGLFVSAGSYTICFEPLGVIEMFE